MARNDKRKAAIAALKAYADEIRTEIERQARDLNDELSRVEKSIVELSGEIRPHDRIPVPENQTGGTYTGLGPQAAVERFLRAHPDRMFRSKMIATELKSLGFTVANPKLAGQQVAIALIRMAKKGLAVEGKIGDKRAFQLSPKHGLRV
jgi:hypothetical protein